MRVSQISTTAWGLPLILILLVGADTARAQGRATETFLNQQRAAEESIRAQLDRELPAEQKVDFDWGGWYNGWLFHYDDGVQHRTLWRNDFRLWAGMTLDQGAHELYARGLMSFLDWGHGDSYNCDDHDIVGPNLERGYYKFDLRNAMKAYAKQNIENNFKLEIGRDYVEFGTGYALSLPLDHVSMTAEISKVEVTGLMARPIHSMSDLDQSRPTYGYADRSFWGIQTRYLGFEKHVPFAYVLWNEDQAHDPDWAWPQRFDYDSFYAGFGSKGELLKNLRYGTEWVFEQGHSYRYGGGGRAPIEAWAFDATLEYLTQWRTRPRFIGEYMFASGDGDRRGSPTNAIGGNTRGRDTSFVGFGYRDTGMSFAPLLSNIHIWRLGASFIPFDGTDFLDKLELGTDWYLYWKQHRQGAVSDATADEQSGYLGWEMDYFANWRLTSDLSLTLRYGLFFPGSAFSDEEYRSFFLTGVTWSF
mgnify:CR=1 FL=1